MNPGGNPLDLDPIAIVALIMVVCVTIAVLLSNGPKPPRPR